MRSSSSSRPPCAGDGDAERGRRLAGWGPGVAVGGLGAGDVTGTCHLAGRCCCVRGEEYVQSYISFHVVDCKLFESGFKIANVEIQKMLPNRFSRLRQH
jgi:hypothetical protein